MMETDEDGNKRQFFPITHISAVLGLREFMEGNFFQANFDQVMAQLQAHYNRVSQEIDKKASEIEQHANQKIEEFDTKISDSDEKIANLETEIKDIQELVESNDIPTRDEVSANVVYQLVGKEKVQLTFSTDFTNKVTGSLAENRNIAKVYAASTLGIPGKNGSEVGRYDQLASLDNNTYQNATKIAGNSIQLESQFDVINIVTEGLSELFWESLGLITTLEKVNFLKENFAEIIASSYGYGSSPSGNKLTMYRAANDSIGEHSSWINCGNHANSTVTRVDAVLRNKSQFETALNKDGYFSIATVAEASDGVGYSVINIDYLKLDFTIELSMNQFLKSMMAAYSGENSVSLSEPQNVEGLKNFSDGVQSNGIDVATQDMTKVTLFQSTEISNVKGTAVGIVWPIDETAIVFGGVGAHARRGGTSEPGTIYFNEAGQYLIELLWFVNSGTATRKYVYMDWIKHGTTDLLFRSGIGKINGFSYTSSVPGGGIITMGKDEGVDILLKTNVEDLIAGVKIYYIKITKIG